MKGKVVIPVFNPLLARLALINLKVARKKRIANYLANFSVRKLQLGAGANRLPGWLNSEGFVSSSFTHSRKNTGDYIFLDVCQPFPFQDNSVDYIFQEHVIEHLNYHQGLMLRMFQNSEARRTNTDCNARHKFFLVYIKSHNSEQKCFLGGIVRFNSEVWVMICMSE
jgi:hypothetical protein